ncbi:MAG TPA: nucleotidyl transferase AbiEii/AbiGii toxin family protein [Syntrophobacteraceae bacterium]|nr:nucleotidyl transferase AbiEii/AbiGii toxin family protein [Syntrophobacteraceae bacterium]
MIEDEQSGAQAEAWEEVLASLCRLQKVLPDAVLVGGTASALYAGHRFSFDHDHVLPDLRERFDTVLAELESVAGWETARVKRPILILVSLDGVETGVRQLRRARPLETTVMHVGGHDVTLPTLPEVLRIKAFLCLERNAARDYLDLAALASHMGIAAAGDALWSMDELYPQKGGDPWVVRTQLVMQLAAPQPYDIDNVKIAEYKGVKPPFDCWSHVAEVCGKVSDSLLNACVQALRADSSPEAKRTRTKVDAWRKTRAEGQAPQPKRLPGLET